MKGNVKEKNVNKTKKVKGLLKGVVNKNKFIVNISA